MGDFFQAGVITTLHNLVDRPVEELDTELCSFAKSRPMGLILPSLYSELSRPALENIVQTLMKVPYLEHIVVGLDRADEPAFQHALRFFNRLPQKVSILWKDGPRLLAIDQQLAAQDIAPTILGKGRNFWYCLGYMLALNSCEAIAIHDCDITTYQPDLLARLLYPVANPNFDYQFCKGFYARVHQEEGDTAAKMRGRVARLMVTPLIRALKLTLGPMAYLEYLDSFRYPLAGEFSFRKDVINSLRIPSDWGLEIGILSELERNYALNKLCQVDIADIYDHKHQDLSAENPTQGLSRMSIDIAKAIFRKIATYGTVFSHETFRSIKAAYFRQALELVETYRNDSIMNGLAFDTHAEEQSVELFAANIMIAGEKFLNNPMETPFIPSWNRAISAIPDVLEQLKQAVAADYEEQMKLAKAL